MKLKHFLDSKNYINPLKQILLDIEKGSIKIYEKFNEEHSDIFGSSGEHNIQGEEVQKLDLIANDIFINRFQENQDIHAILSEENENIIECHDQGDYLIAMDPLDGSSNIDVNIPVGSIFSVLKKIEGTSEQSFLQKGNKQQMACYIIYGTSTMLVFAINNEAFGFTLNTKEKEYFLTHPNIKSPENGNIFSINEGNINSIEPEIIDFIKYCKQLNREGKRTHTGRFIGSLIADFHRNMLKGGIFIYPATSDKPKGQLRLIYECNPIAFIADASNCKSSNLKINILDIKPSTIHQRTPFAVGSTNPMNKLLSFYN